MKKIITLLLAVFLSANIYSQNLDTVLIRSNIILTAGQWSWLRGKIGATTDSLVLAVDRRIHSVVMPLLPLAQGFNTNIPIDSLPGRFVLIQYRIMKIFAGEIVADYTAMNTALNLPALSTWTTPFDAAILRDRNSSINVGKNFYIDQ